MHLKRFYFIVYFKAIKIGEQEDEKNHFEGKLKQNKMTEKLSTEILLF